MVSGARDQEADAGGDGWSSSGPRIAFMVGSWVVIPSATPVVGESLE